MMDIREVQFFDKKSALHADKSASCGAVEVKLYLKNLKHFIENLKKEKYTHLL